MKILKTFTAAALLLIGTTVMAQGQGQGNRQQRTATERAKGEAKSLAKSLELSADQAAKIEEVSLKYAVKDSVAFAAMRGSQSTGTIDREAMMKAREATTLAKTAEMKALLNEDQMKKYETYLKERQNRGGQGQGNRPQGDRPQGDRQGGNRQGGNRQGGDFGGQNQGGQPQGGQE